MTGGISQGEAPGQQPPSGQGNKFREFQDRYGDET